MYPLPLSQPCVGGDHTLAAQVGVQRPSLWGGVHWREEGLHLLPPDVAHSILMTFWMAHLP